MDNKKIITFIVGVSLLVGLFVKISMALESKQDKQIYHNFNKKTPTSIGGR